MVPQFSFILLNIGFDLALNYIERHVMQMQIIWRAFPNLLQKNSLNKLHILTLRYLHLDVLQLRNH